MIRRCSALIDQPLGHERARPGGRAARDASAGRSAGRSRWACATSGAPKWCIQTRLTITRAVSGLSGRTIARASSSRPLPSRNGLRSGPASTGEEPPRDRLARAARDCRGGRRAGSTGVGDVFQDHRPRRGAGAARRASSRRPCAAPGASPATARSGRSARSPIGFSGTSGGRVRAVEDLAELLQGRVGQRAGRGPVQRGAAGVAPARSPRPR